MSLDDSAVPGTGQPAPRKRNVPLIVGLVLVVALGLVAAFTLVGGDDAPAQADCVSEKVTLTTAPVMEDLVKEAVADVNADAANSGSDDSGDSSGTDPLISADANAANTDSSSDNSDYSHNLHHSQFSPHQPRHRLVQLYPVPASMFGNKQCVNHRVHTLSRLLLLFALLLNLNCHTLSGYASFVAKEVIV